MKKSITDQAYYCFFVGLIFQGNLVAVKNIQKAKVNLDRDVLLELKEVISFFITD